MTEFRGFDYQKTIVPGDLILPQKCTASDFQFALIPRAALQNLARAHKNSICLVEIGEENYVLVGRLSLLSKEKTFVGAVVSKVFAFALNIYKN